MDNVIKHINIDLYSPTSYDVIHAQQGDNNSRVIKFSLYDKGELYNIPDDILIRMEGHRGDGSSFIKDDNCIISDNVICATLDSDILYAHGIVEAKIVLTKPAQKNDGENYSANQDDILSTIPFRIHVQKNPCDKNRVETEKRSLIDFLIQKFREVKEALTKHMDDKGNPHEVTKAQVGLGNADNTADKDKYVASANQLTTSRTIDGINFNGTKSIAHYCICPSLGNDAAKTVSLPGFQLVNGAKAAVLFQYGNTAASPTLTVNNTGAKPIHYNGEAISLANAPILKGCCEFVYDGLGHWLLTGRHTFVKGASETAYRDGLVSLTPADIGASPSGHTHSYAGSASPGGPATSANKLNTDAGSQKQPVYFKNGIPIACEDISNYQEVTQAEYDRLTASEKEDVVFYITDVDNSIPTASDTEKGLVTVDKTLSLTSENPVQNKAIKSALNEKVDKVSGKGLSTNDYTNDEMNKLSTAASMAENAYEAAGVAGRAATGAAITASDAYAKANAAVEGLSAELRDERLSLGLNASASGARAIAEGYYACASKNEATAVGAYASADGFSSVAVGAYARADDSSSTALGHNAIAVGRISIAVGDGARAQTEYAVAIGGYAYANGNGSISLGNATKATQGAATAIGVSANAGDSCTAVGANAEAPWSYATVIGASAKAPTAYTTVVGSYAASNGSYSVALGANAHVFGNSSMALGGDARVDAVDSVALGHCAMTSNHNSIQLGNASWLSSITAKVGITVTSDERDKADVNEISDGAVGFLKKVRAVSYVFNGRGMYIDDENLSEEDKEKKGKYGLCAYDRKSHASGTKKGKRRRVGVIAQEVQDALAETFGSPSYANLVNDNLFDFDPSEIPEDVESQLAVNYEGFIPFLIKAVQELDERIRILENGGTE